MRRHASEDEQARALRLGRRLLSQCEAYVGQYIPEDADRYTRNINLAMAAVQLIMLAASHTQDDAEFQPLFEGVGCALGDVLAHQNDELFYDLLTKLHEGMQRTIERKIALRGVAGTA